MFPYNQTVLIDSSALNIVDIQYLMVLLSVKQYACDIWCYIPISFDSHRLNNFLEAMEAPSCHLKDGVINVLASVKSSY